MSLSWSPQLHQLLCPGCAEHLLHVVQTWCHRGCLVLAGPASSHSSEELINKLTSLVHPMLMEWEEIGCSYNTSTGVKVVLQVSRSTQAGNSCPS